MLLVDADKVVHLVFTISDINMALSTDGHKVFYMIRVLASTHAPGIDVVYIYGSIAAHLARYEVV